MPEGLGEPLGELRGRSRRGSRLSARQRSSGIGGADGRLASLRTRMPLPIHRGARTALAETQISTRSHVTQKRVTGQEERKNGRSRTMLPRRANCHGVTVPVPPASRSRSQRGGVLPGPSCASARPPNIAFGRRPSRANRTSRSAARPPPFAPQSPHSRCSAAALRSPIPTFPLFGRRSSQSKFTATTPHPRPSNTKIPVVPPRHPGNVRANGSPPTLPSSRSDRRRYATSRPKKSSLTTQTRRNSDDACVNLLT